MKDKIPLLGQLTGFTEFCRISQPLESSKYINITDKYKWCSSPERSKRTK